MLTGGYDALSELVFTGFDSLQASTQKNAGRLIDIVRAWCWEKVPPFSRWKILSLLESAARRIPRRNCRLRDFHG